MQEKFKKLTENADQNAVERFLQYNEKNPHVYELFKKYSLEAKNAGRKRFSVWLIANRIRWYTNIETTGKDFKINNDYLAFYSRLLIAENPDLDGLFLMKKMKKTEPNLGYNV
jgi:hypothetical protein